MQVIFFKENVAIALCNTTFKEILHRGDTLQKPYRTHPIPRNYVKGVDIEVVDRHATEESLTVTTTKVVPFYVDDIDRIQNKWDTVTKFAQDGMRSLNNILDQVPLSEPSNAAIEYIDAGDIGGSSGSNMSASVSNVDQIFTAASRELDERSIPPANRFYVVGSRMMELIRRYIGGRETSMGDIVGQNGKIMQRFGFEIYYSNNIYYTATLTLSAAISTGQYVTINGAVLEFVTTCDSSEASSAYIGVKVSGTPSVNCTNLTYAINEDTTNGTEGTEWGDYDAANDKARWKLISCGAVATDNTTSMGLVAFGDIVVSDNLTNATNVWSAQTSYPLFGLKGATDLVVQKSPNVEFKEAEKRLGRYVYPWIRDKVVHVKSSLIDSEAQKWVTRAKDKILSTLNDLTRGLQFLQMQKSELCI